MQKLQIRCSLAKNIFFLAANTILSCHDFDAVITRSSKRKSSPSNHNAVPKPSPCNQPLPQPDTGAASGGDTISDAGQPPMATLASAGTARLAGEPVPTTQDTNRGKRSSRSRPANPKKPKASRRTLWSTDGPNESVSSLSVLLDWLTKECNYTKWRGGDKQNGDTKTALAKEIAERIRLNGVEHLRKPKDILTKISLLEQSFRTASDFLANTGAGITNESSLQAAIEERCPHYNMLKDVMDDRPSTRPLLTTEDAGFGEAANDSAGSDSTDFADRNAIDASPGSTQTARAQGGSQGRRISSIRPPSARAANAASAWTDFNSAYAAVKKQEREDARQMNDESLAFQREQMQQNAQLEVRRIECAEEESRCRVLLLQAQAERERVQARKEEVALRMELARCRKQFREEGMTDDEVNQVLPIT